MFNKTGESRHRISNWLRVQKLQVPPLDTCNNAGRKDTVTIHFHDVHIFSCLISVFSEVLQSAKSASNRITDLTNMMAS